MRSNSHDFTSKLGMITFLGLVFGLLWKTYQRKNLWVTRRDVVIMNVTLVVEPEARYAQREIC